MRDVAINKLIMIGQNLFASATVAFESIEEATKNLVGDTGPHVFGLAGRFPVYKRGVLQCMVYLHS